MQLIPSKPVTELGLEILLPKIVIHTDIKKNGQDVIVFLILILDPFVLT